MTGIAGEVKCLNQLSRLPICSDVELPLTAICNHSEYAQWALIRNRGGYWCGIVCYGEYRLYKVDDGERHWVWAKSKEQIIEYWKSEYDADTDKIEAVSYGEAAQTIISCEEGGKKALLDIVFSDYKNSKKLEFVASTVW